MLEGLKFAIRLKLFWHLFKEMRGCLRGQSLPLTLVALIFSTLLIWAWERSPYAATFLPSTNQFGTQSNMLSPEVFTGTPVNVLVYTHKQFPGEEVKSDIHTLEKQVPGDSPKSSSALNSFGDATNDPPKSSSTLNSSRDATDDPPKSSSTLNSFGDTTKDIDGIQMPTENKECNYAKGKWVADKRRPLYSGFRCTQWLSPMWACRWMKRPDFSYEKFRWEPYQCEIPEFDRFKFLRRMQDKTIALVGDSLGRQQFQSLMCMVTGGKESPEVQDVGREYGLVKARGALRPDGWAYWFPDTNTTILYYWSASLCELEPLKTSDPDTSYAMHLDRPTTFLTKYLHRFDVLVLNTGHHWNKGKLKGNRWELYVDGAPTTDKRFENIAFAKNHTVYSVAKWVNSRRPQHPRLKAFFRTMSPRHFVNGDWNTGGSCDNLNPLAGGSEVSQDGSSDTVVAGAVKGTKVKILDITALSQLRDEGHISRYSKKDANSPHDCLHWCLPGIPDTWNEILLAQL